MVNCIWKNRFDSKISNRKNVNVPFHRNKFSLLLYTFPATLQD